MTSYLDILQVNHVYLKNHLDATPVLDHLYSGKVFSLEDYERCAGREPHSERCQALLDTLKMKGGEGYRVFCGVLHKTQPFIKERLDSTAAGKGLKDMVVVSKETFDEEMAKKQSEIQRLNNVISQNERKIEEQRRDLRMIYEEMDTMVEEATSNQLEIQAYKRRCEKLRRETNSAVWCFQDAKPEEVVLLGPRLTIKSTSDHPDDMWRISRYPDYMLPITMEYQSTPIYWETNEEVDLHSLVVFGHPLFELGFYEEKKDQNGRRNSENKHPTWGISVELCPIHHFKSVCTILWADSQLYKCFIDTIPNQKGTQARLSFGTVLDTDSGIIGFIDNNRKTVLGKFEVDLEESVFQVYTTGARQTEGCHTELSVTTGADIYMDKEKQNRILQILK